MRGRPRVASTRPAVAENIDPRAENIDAENIDPIGCGGGHHAFAPPTAPPSGSARALDSHCDAIRSPVLYM